MKKIYLTFASVGFLLVGIAHAQTVNPQWRLNIPSSTITPIISGLQVPCANIVGGCNAATSSGIFAQLTGANNFTGDNSLASGSTVYASPNGYLLSNATSAYLYYQNLCNNKVAALGGPVTIQLPTQNISSSSWGNGTLVLTNRCTFVGAKGGGTVWNGASVPNVPIVQYAVPATPHIAGGGIIGVTVNCTDPTISTSSPSIGLLEGSSTNFGGAHTETEWNTISNCGVAVEITSGTYNNDIGFNTIRGSANNIDIEFANNSTESVNIHDNWIVDPANNSATDCVNVKNGDNINYTNNTTDNCQFHQHNNSSVFISGNKTENAGGAYPPYIPFLQDNSPLAFMQITGEKAFYQGTATQTYPALFDLNGQAIINGVSVVEGTGSTTIINILQDSAAGTNENVQICGFNSYSNYTASYGGYTEFAPKALNVPTSTPWNGCVSQIANGNAVWQGAQSNGHYLISAPIDVNGNLNATGTITQSGVLVLTANAITSSSAITSNYFPYWGNGTGGLNGTSSIYYNSTTGFTGVGTMSPTGTWDIQDSHAVGSGGIDLIVDDASSTLNTPLIYSHKPTATAAGSLVYLGINAFVNPAGAAVVYNASDGGWAFDVDSRNNPSAPLNLVSFTTANVARTIFTVTQAGLFSIGTSTTATALLVNDSANNSSTLRIGTGNLRFGCIEMNDSVNSSTEEYIYTVSGTLTATTTKPTFCQ
jgi:hypothetical protein